MEVHMNPDVSKQFLRQRELLASYLPFSATTLWRKIKSGEFPQPVKLSPGIIAWRSSDVFEWLSSKEML
jgi:predicted DNA-binding transcriptional regulator AlpA